MAFIAYIISGAKLMYFRLSGKEHSVFTGVAIVICHENTGMGLFCFFYNYSLVFV